MKLYLRAENMLRLDLKWKHIERYTHINRSWKFSCPNE